MEISMSDLQIFGSVKVGERGQIVIPKDARDAFDINPGDILLVLGHGKRGITIMKADLVKEITLKILGSLDQSDDNSAI
jgi:AbrB family looped-hinge helix DNA binding protein